MCDEIIVACGYGTKTVLDKLSIKFPLMPVQGYTLTTKNPNHDKQQMKYSIITDQGVFITPLKDNYRISGLADIGYHGEFKANRMEFMKKIAK